MTADGSNKGIFLRMLAASTIGLIGAGSVIAIIAKHRQHQKDQQYKKQPTPLDMHSTALDITIAPKSFGGNKIEMFSHYVARQIGFDDINECPKLLDLAYEYLRLCDYGCKNGNPNIYGFVANEPDPGNLYLKLVDELERCILGYFAFHWGQAPAMISRALSTHTTVPNRRLRNIILAATRKQRFDKLLMDKKLNVQRVLRTLVMEMKVIGIKAKGKDVMVLVCHSKRSPVLLLMGGGMGAGKSTVVEGILNEPFWREAASEAVRIEADQFREMDILYMALNAKTHHDMLHTAELVHEACTKAASSVLVTALNQGRDVIMDSTLSWAPYVEQTILMARNVHLHKYRMVEKEELEVMKDGTKKENYWKTTEQQEDGRKPYRIEMVGVVCDASVAVVRGMRRAILMRRAVRVKSQLLSHKRFADAFPRYCQQVDNARLYCTDATEEAPPKLIGWKEGDMNLLVDPEDIDYLRTISTLNADAESINELYQQPDPTLKPDSVWQDIVMSPSRADLQRDLKAAIRRVESRSGIFM